MQCIPSKYNMRTVWNSNSHNHPSCWPNTHVPYCFEGSQKAHRCRHGSGPKEIVHIVEPSTGHPHRTREALPGELRTDSVRQQLPRKALLIHTLPLFLLSDLHQLHRPEHAPYPVQGTPLSFNHDVLSFLCEVANCRISVSSSSSSNCLMSSMQQMSLYSASLGKLHLLPCCLSEYPWWKKEVGNCSPSNITAQ